MASLRGDWFLKGLIIAVSGLILTVAVAQLRTVYRFGDVAYLGRQIENRQPLSNDTIASYVPQALAVLDARVCQAQFVKGGLAVLLRNLDNQNQDADFDGWSTAIGNADAYLQFALGCLPTNGNLWLRLAMVRQQISEQPGEQARLLEFSQLFAPAEENIVRARFLLWNRLSQDSLQLAEGPLQSDIRLLCSERLNGVRRRLPEARPQLQAMVAKMAGDSCQFGPPPGKTGR